MSFLLGLCMPKILPGKARGQIVILLELYLDRDLISASFYHIFPSCIVHSTSAGHSNHLARVIHLSLATNPYVHKKPSSLSHIGSMITNAWNTLINYGCWIPPL